MKTIGILGGMSPESTTHYYDGINKNVVHTLGGNNSADLILSSGNFQVIVDLMKANEWNEIAELLISKASGMKALGASELVIATNTIHKVANQIGDGSGLPIIHIGECVAEKVNEAGIKRVGLLGTKTTMTESFIKEKLNNCGIDVFTPTNEDELNLINSIIFKELCIGKTIRRSKEYFLKVIKSLLKQYKIEGIILGCTEIDLLINSNDTDIPLFDTTECHINAISQIIVDSVKIKK